MRWLGKWLPLLGFRGSADYWERRYRLGGDSGAGSGGVYAAYKAHVLNAFVRDNHIEDVIEFGSGDGRQLALADYPRYLGLDISADAVESCRRRFANDAGKRFELLDRYEGQTADMSISLDVLFHLVEDDVYFAYLDRLFNAGRRFVVVYATSVERPTKTFQHVRHRPVESDLATRFPDFIRLADTEAALPPPPPTEGAGGPARFFMYRRAGS